MIIFKFVVNFDLNFKFWVFRKLLMWEFLFMIDYVSKFD